MAEGSVTYTSPQLSGPGGAKATLFSIDVVVLIPTSRFEKQCREGVYSEIYRVLKPGCVFACYEWCLTDKYDASNEQHRLIKKQIEVSLGEQYNRRVRSDQQGWMDPLANAGMLDTKATTRMV